MENLKALTVAQLIELRDRQLNRIPTLVKQSMMDEAKDAKALADQCNAELQTRRIK